VADGAVALEAHRHTSRNSALEFERLIQVANTERDQARTRQREAELEVERCGNSMKKFQDARDAARLTANDLARELEKAQAELALHLEGLEKAHGWSVAAMRELGLVPLELLDRSVRSITSFFSDLAGQLKALPELLEARARREGRQVIDALARLILPRVRHLAPNFPFNELLDDFATDEERDEATAAVESFITELKEAAKHE
jgi:hypothetical protein